MFSSFFFIHVEGAINRRLTFTNSSDHYLWCTPQKNYCGINWHHCECRHSFISTWLISCMNMNLNLLHLHLPNKVIFFSQKSCSNLCVLPTSKVAWGMVKWNVWEHIIYFIISFWVLHPSSLSTLASAPPKCHKKWWNAWGHIHNYSDSLAACPLNSNHESVCFW